VCTKCCGRLQYVWPGVFEQCYIGSVEEEGMSAKVIFLLICSLYCLLNPLKKVVSSKVSGGIVDRLRPNPSEKIR
jgi:hypothetical protein